MKTIISALTAILCIASGMNLFNNNTDISIRPEENVNTSSVCETTVTESSQKNAQNSLPSSAAVISSDVTEKPVAQTETVTNAAAAESDSDEASNDTEFRSDSSETPETPAAVPVQNTEAVSDRTASDEADRKNDDGKDRGFEKYGVRGNAFFGSKYPERNRIVIRNGKYLKVNFMKDKAYQEQINADIRTLIDEKFTDSSREVKIYTTATNGYLFLTFHYNNAADEFKWENIETLTYDIIEQRKIESAEELFTDTFEMYDMINEYVESLDQASEPEMFYGEVTAENIKGFDWQSLYFEGDRQVFWNAVTLIDCYGYAESDLAKFCKLNYLREMDNCIDESFSELYNVNIFE